MDADVIGRVEDVPWDCMPCKARLDAPGADKPELEARIDLLKLALEGYDDAKTTGGNYGAPCGPAWKCKTGR